MTLAAQRSCSGSWPCAQATEQRRFDPIPLLPYVRFRAGNFDTDRELVAGKRNFEHV